MNPQALAGRVPDAHQTVDQVVNHADQGLQAVAQPVVMNVGHSDEIQEGNVFMEDDDDNDNESVFSSNITPRSNWDGPANTGQAEASNSSHSEGHERFHHPRWNLVALDDYGRPRELHIHCMSTLRYLIARSRSTTSTYVFWYMLQAVFYGSTVVVSALLALGLDPNDPRTRYPDGSTLLHVAAFRGHAAIIVLLLRHGARVDAVCRSRCTALHLAAIPGCLQAAVILVSAGASVDALDMRGHSPMCYAIAHGRRKVLRALKAFRRVIGKKCERGKNAWRRQDRETSSGQHFFTLLFPPPK